MYVIGPGGSPTRQIPVKHIIDPRLVGDHVYREVTSDPDDDHGEEHDRRDRDEQVEETIRPLASAGVDLLRHDTLILWPTRGAFDTKLKLCVFIERDGD